MKTFYKSFSITLLAISVIILCTFSIGAIFKYLASLKTNNLKIAEVKLDVLDANSTSINGNTLTWKDSNNIEVSQIQEGETYHIDSFNVKNTGSVPIEYSVSLSGDNQTILDNLDIVITPNSTYLEPDGLSIINISLSISDNASNDIQGLTLSDININIEGQAADLVYDD